MTPRVACCPVILSDRSIREALASGRVVIDPLQEANIQPSSVDVTLDRYFRLFMNHSYRVIDVKEDQEDLTELVEVREDDVFILHPGEFVLGATAEQIGLPADQPYGKGAAGSKYQGQRGPTPSRYFENFR